MTRKLLTLLVCVVIASSSFLTAFAEAETISTPDYVAFYEEPTEARTAFSLFSASTYAAVTSPTRNYTYDISKIDWYSSAPSAVTDVYKMAVVQSPDASSLEPFIFAVAVSDVKAVAFVGVNVGTAFRRATDATTPYRQFAVGYTKGFRSYSTHYLYRAAFDADGNITEDWQLLTPSVWCSKETTGATFYYYPNTYATSNYVRDFFFSGCNASMYDYSNAIIIYDRYDVSTITNFGAGGFSSSSSGIPLFNSYDFPSISHDVFSLPTLEQWQQLQEQNRHEETGSWISRLGDRISGFFETLKNWLLWFSAEGSASYNNPFSNILSDIQLFFDDQVSDTNDFKNSLSDTLDRVVGYISSGSGVISAVLTGVPILSAFVAFFVVFSVIRKVVGR